MSPFRTVPRVIWLAAVLAAVAAGAGIAIAPPMRARTLHYAPNHNFDAHGRYVPASSGFNLADVSSAAQLEALPAGVRGLAWIGLCGGVNASFLSAMRPYSGHRNVFGFYLADDPAPAGACPPARLRAEADWVHQHFPGAVTFITLMNLAKSRSPSYLNGYTPANSHVDLFGVGPYLCRIEWGHCDLRLIDKFVAAAEAAGIPRNRIVPVFQAFGGGRWKDDEGGSYAIPRPEQVEQMLARWRTAVPHPVFDMAYSWGSQDGDTALENISGEVRAVFVRHNRQGGRQVGTFSRFLP